MRKRIINSTKEQTSSPEQEWINIEELAEVEITSEDATHPIESALLFDREAGWRAAEPGKQTIRLIFNSPLQLRRIWLNFEENSTERTQEYTLLWSPDGGESYQEIVRQQWNFSLQGATSETEDHHVDLPGVTVLELNIIPEISGGHAIASLAQLRLA